MRPSVYGPALTVQTCARRLAPLEDDDALGGLAGAVTWHGPAKLPDHWHGSEATVQARAGLMHLHGRDAGRPRRLGLEVASVAAGVLAAQGLLAAAIGRRRDRPVGTVETSVLEAGLWAVCHHLAAATGGDEWVPVADGPKPGPPFGTADGRWFEIETLDTDVWKDFWGRLGAGGADLGRAWALFRPRYYRGVCSLPPGLHQATARHTTEQVAAAARASGVSLVFLRDYADVLHELGPWPGHPVVEGTTSARSTARHRGGGGGRGDDEALPLHGVRVVEATSRMQGPLAGLLLRMLGAEVIKVEPPGGDVGRMVPPLAGDTGSFFLCCNRGKRSVELDLARPGGRVELAELIAGADVFLHNWRPGKAAEWGLGADDLQGRHPGLVYVEASGWGDHAPAPRLLGTDFLVQAHAGVGGGISPVGEPPFPSRVILVDYMGALVTSEGVLHGLYRRERGGRASRMGTSLLAGAMALQAHVLAALATGQGSGRRAGRPVWTILDHPLPTADGHVVVSAPDAASLRRAARAVGLSGEGIGAKQLAARLRAGETGRWEEVMADAGVPCAAVATDLTALTSDPRLAALFEPLAGTCRAPASPWRFHP